MKFKDNAKTALAKVLSDLIQSDGIVNQGEIDYLKQVFSVLRITNDNLKKSSILNLSDAVRTLRACGDAEKAVILHTIQQLSVSDDNIDPNESLLITALILSIGIALPNMQLIPTELISIPNPIFESTNTVVYIESHYDDKINHAIVKEHTAIVDLLADRGMNFLYLPMVMKEIRQKKRTFKQILNYLEPLLSAKQMQLIEHDLNQFDTTTLTKEIFLNYLNAKGFDLDHPSFLIKIKNLRPSPYQDYLILNITQSPTNTLTQFYKLNDSVLDIRLNALGEKDQRYLKLLTMPKGNAEKDELQYTGFHKIIVDTIVKYHSSKGPSRLQITENGHLVLLDRNKTEVKIQSIGRALYILYLRHEEGIALTELVDYREELMEIYAMTSGYSDANKMNKTVDNLVNCIGSTINPLLSRIRKAFTSLLGEQAKAYLIEGKVCERRKIHLDRRLVIDEMN